MDKYQLTKRTKSFAVNIIKYCESLPRNVESDIIRRQLIRSATSVGANYRAALRARSKKEFIAKISIVLEEADESLYWLELLEDLDLGKSTQLFDLKSDTLELVKIFATTRKTSKDN